MNIRRFMVHSLKFFNHYHHHRIKIMNNNLQTPTHPSIASKSKQLIQQDQQDSQIFNQKFLELLNSQSIEPSSIGHPQQSKKSLIDEQQRQIIIERFRALCQNRDSMDYKQFRDSLGLLGRENSFILRIFHLIDEQGLGMISYEDYLKYINTISYGSDFDRQLFGWKIFSGGLDQIMFSDLQYLFEEISMIWNALTGDIVQPKKKFLQELFTILDVDQDDVITFQDYRIFYKVQPIIFGWFQYLNNMDVNEKESKHQMEKTKNLLQVNNFKISQSSKNTQEIHTLLETQQRLVESKIGIVIGEIKKCVNIGYETIAHNQIFKNVKHTQPQNEEKQINPSQRQMLSKTTPINQINQYKNIQKQRRPTISSSTNNSLSSKLSVLGKYYNINNETQSKMANKYGNQKQQTIFRTKTKYFQQKQGTNRRFQPRENLSKTQITPQRNSSTIISQIEQQMSRLKRRKQKIQIQQNKDLNIQLAKHLENLLQKCYKAMNACGQYRELKQISNKYSPYKIRLKEAKMLAINNHSFEQSEEKQKPRKSELQQKEKKKKKNIQVYFGHPNWNLVLNLMVGLRKSIRSLYQLNSFLQLKSTHFGQQHEFLLGSKALNGKSKQVYKFIQMAPVVFEKLRTNYGITNLQYQKSIGLQSLLSSLVMGNLTALNEKCSTGKSGSFFYLTMDNKIFLKTIPKHQFIFFVQILSEYYKHQRDYTNTLIVRIYGLYKLKIYENKQKINTIYFISMENIFKDLNNLSPQKPAINIQIKEVYDLKGSLYGRTGEEGKQLKDNDWIDKKKKIHLRKDIKQIYNNQIKIDAKYFKHNNINDYSLMVAIGEMDKQQWRQCKEAQKSYKLGNVFKSFKGGVLGEREGQFYILSIIDILTVFQMKKKFEYAFKSTFLSKDVSCIPPAEYCKRFRQFMWKAVESEEQEEQQ